MNKCVRWLAVLLVMLMMLSPIGCGKKKESSKKQESEKTESISAEDVAPYIGTWKGSDHDGENVVHYLIVDENGYWNVYMNYATLEKAIRQIPDRYVSFKVTFGGDEPRNNSDHTGCFYEYVKGRDFAKNFAIDEEGMLVVEDARFTMESDHSGEPDDQIVQEVRELFDNAREAALAQ